MAQPHAAEGIAAVMAGLGLAFISLRTVRHEIAAGRLVLIDVEGLPLTREW